MAKKKAAKTAVAPLPGKLSKAEKQLLPKLHLKGIRLIGVNSVVSIRKNEHPTEASIKTSATVGGADDPSVIFVEILLDVDAKAPSGGDDCSTLKLVAHYQCIYNVAKGERDRLASFAETIADVGVRVAWPYLREFVHSLTIRMGLSPITLPLIGMDEEAAGKPAPRKKIRRSVKRPSSR
jgi:preprotein translocase subunit SecB